MRTARIERILAPSLVALGLLMAACTEKSRAPEPPPEAKRYELRGKVVSVNPGVREVMVAHEEIPGFMEAMTMPFYVADGSELRGFNPGDQITGELLVWDKGARLTKLRKADKKE